MFLIYTESGHTEVCIEKTYQSMSHFKRVACSPEFMVAYYGYISAIV